MAVSEEVGESWKNYYLTKEGRSVGVDSLYIFDNGSDCESEGFIRFRDSKTDQAGMFNSKGDIAIPAVYNDLTRVRNGMIIGLKGAEKNIGLLEIMQGVITLAGQEDKKYCLIR
ncbi:hypothetical protein QNH98_03240 [Myroides sp. mNGS23_01]|nr:hypothetical protein [Myroides sp. mNGS23_01]WHT39712.1 hypothetical protein QNH98_03240 [Myroides sp. mNGS23_01]